MSGMWTGNLSAKLKFWEGDTVEKDFSEGFMHDVADLLDGCMKEKTDTAEVILNVNGKELHITMTFSIKVPEASLQGGVKSFEGGSKL